MSINCTWVHCLENATQPQRSSDGSIWANLCSRHEHELVQAVRSGEAPSICRAWVLAQGGSEITAERFSPTREALARVLGKMLRHKRCIECAGGNLMCNGDAQRGGKSWDLCAKNPAAPLLPEHN